LSRQWICESWQAMQCVEYSNAPRDVLGVGVVCARTGAAASQDNVSAANAQRQKVGLGYR